MQHHLSLLITAQIKKLHVLQSSVDWIPVKFHSRVMIDKQKTWLLGSMSLYQEATGNQRVILQMTDTSDLGLIGMIG